MWGWSLSLPYLVMIFRESVWQNWNKLPRQCFSCCSLSFGREEKGSRNCHTDRGHRAVWQHWNWVLTEPSAASQSLKMESKYTLITGTKPLSSYTPLDSSLILFTLTSALSRESQLEVRLSLPVLKREQKRYPHFQVCWGSKRVRMQTSMALLNIGTQVTHSTKF